MTLKEIKVNSSIVKATEIEVFQKECCRILKSESGCDYYLGYTVSVGPYHIDLPVYRELNREQTKDYLSGLLDVPGLAKNWSHEDAMNGKFERKS